MRGGSRPASNRWTPEGSRRTAWRPAPRADRTYLVTGGLGRLGLTVARWLAEAGAGAVVLNARREPDETAARRIAELRAAGTEVRFEAGDVADEAAARVVTAITEEGSGLPPLGGVFHCAGVFRDAALANQEWTRFEEVLRPKVLGAWNLHRATASLALDRFVLFSSVMGVVGNAGQAAYAAANAFLDQLALHRRALGLAGQSIAWGPWSSEDAREAFPERVAQQLEAIGMGWIRPAHGLRTLERLLADDAPLAVAAPVDWTRFTAAVSAPQPLVEGLRPEEPAPPDRGDEPGDIAVQLAATPKRRRREVLLDFVREEVRSVLRLRAAPSPEVGFFDLGMDSLMAVELRNRLNQAFAGAYVAPNTLVFDYPTPAELTERVLEELGGLPEPAAEPQRAAAPSSSDGGRIAVVGMACRFPGGPDPEAFWAQLAAGEQAVTRGRAEELVADDREASSGSFGAYVPGLDRFDAEFFRIAPLEAELLDPQQRLLLEVSWEALEDAALDPDGLRGSRTGVYAGISGLGLPGARWAGGRRYGPRPVRGHGLHPVGGDRAGGVRAGARRPGDRRGHGVFVFAGGDPPGGGGARPRRGGPGARRRM